MVWKYAKYLNKYFAKETQEGIINMKRASLNITSHQRNAHQKQMLPPMCKDDCYQSDQRQQTFLMVLRKGDNCIRIKMKIGIVVIKMQIFLKKWKDTTTTWYICLLSAYVQKGNEIRYMYIYSSQFIDALCTTVKKEGHPWGMSYG